MMTVSEVSRLTGVSIRTLQYYDKIGLLHPSGHTEAGYRLYDDTALAALQQILLFREMEFPLKDIRQIMTQPGFDREKALTQQMELLMLKKQRLENLIDLARRMQQTGGKPMDFTAFDTTKLEEYARQAKQAWGTTPEYQEFEGKSAKRTPQESNTINAQLMAIVAAFGTLQGKKATVYPGMEDKLIAAGAEYTGLPITLDGNIITGEALGAAIPFALALASRLAGQQASNAVKQGIVYRY